MSLNINNIKRAIRLQFPPAHPLEAGATLGSRPYEALPQLLPVVTYSFIILSAVLFFLTDLQTANDPLLHREMLTKLGHRDHLNIITRDWWGVFTAPFFHGGMLHIIMNSMALFTLGSLLEKGIGSLKTLILYLMIGGVSSTAQVLVTVLPIYLATDEQTLFSLNDFGSSLGLSGIVFGIVGFMWASWKRWTGFLSVFNIRLLKFVFMWQGLCFILSWSGAQAIANTAHISALVIGFFIGMWMCYGVKYAKLWFSLTSFTLLLCILGLIAYHIKFTRVLEPYIQELQSKGFLVTSALFQ